jgi:hypothetical protein
VKMTFRDHRVRPDQMEEVTRRADTDWIESLRQLQGFVNAYAVRLADDRLAFVTTFVDGSTAEQGKEASVAWVSQKLMDLDVEPGETWEGAVVSHAGSD